MFATVTPTPITWVPHTAPSDFAAKCQRTIEAVKRVMRSIKVTTVACSYGKDSSAVLALTLEACRQLAEEGINAPVRIITSDTLVENPSQAKLNTKMSARALEWANGHSLDVEQEWVTPDPVNHYLVAMLGGRAVASVASSDAACSVDLKIRPLNKVRNRYSKQFGAHNILTLIGTRLDESQRRGQAMAERGESDTTPRITDNGSLSLSPIAQWSEADVWKLLNGSARQTGFETLDFAPTIAHYEAMGQETCNVLSFNDSAKTTKSPCGSARGGCFVCQKVANDHSLTNMLDRFPHFEGHARLSRVIRAGHWVPENRSFIGKTADDQSGRIRVFSNSYSPDWTANLLKWVLSIDANEDDRAATMSARRGAPVERRFPRLLQPEHEMLIAFMWARYGVQEPGRFIRIKEAITQGKRWELPNDAEIEAMEAKANKKLIGKTLGHLQSRIETTSPNAYRDNWRDLIGSDSNCATDLMLDASGDRAWYRSGKGVAHDTVAESDTIECDLSSLRDRDGNLGIAYDDFLWWMHMEFAQGTHHTANDELNFLIRNGIIRAKKGYQSTLAKYQHFNLVLADLKREGPLSTLEDVLNHPRFHGAAEATQATPTPAREHSEQLALL